MTVGRHAPAGKLLYIVRVRGIHGMLAMITKQLTGVLPYKIVDRLLGFVGKLIFHGKSAFAHTMCRGFESCHGGCRDVETSAYG